MEKVDRRTKEDRLVNAHAGASEGDEAGES
jgi:hypothetical protein